MDYFYAGTGSPAGGLKNSYLKFKYSSSVLALGIDFHNFSLQKDMYKSDGSIVGKNLGNEIDLLLNYNMNRFTVIELGYSMMYANSNLVFAKGQASTDAAADSYRKTGSWFYAMLKITPDFFYTKPAKAK